MEHKMSHLISNFKKIYNFSQLVSPKCLLPKFVWTYFI